MDVTGNCDLPVPQKQFNSVHVVIEGLKKIRPELVSEKCLMLMRQQTHRDIRDEMQRVRHLLLDTRSFKKIEFESSESNGNLLITLVLDEYKNSLSFGANVDAKGHGCLELSSRLPCLFGRFHFLDINLIMKKLNSLELLIQYDALQLFQWFFGTWMASFSTHLDLETFPYGPRIIEMKFSETERQNHHFVMGLYAPERRPSLFALPCIGESMSSMKKSILYKIRYPFRCLIGKGFFASSVVENRTEVASLSTNLKFLKNELCLRQKLERENLLYYLELETRGGVIRNHKAGSLQWWNLPPKDRFSLGGINGNSCTLYGFNQLGPSYSNFLNRITRKNTLKTANIAGQSKNDFFFGGTSYVTMLLSLCRRCTLSGIRFTAFTFGQWSVLSNNYLSNPLNDSRIATGIGIQLPLPRDKIYLEFALSKIIRSMKKDSISKFQFGFNMKTIE